MPDYTIVAGDTLPVFEGTLKYASGAIAEPESVEFQMRSLISKEKLTLTGTSTVVSKAAGTVSFSPAAGDTKEKPGAYMANWAAKIGGKAMTFPTTGWLWVEVAPTLAEGAAQIVGLEEVRDYCNIETKDRTHDNKLIYQIESVSDEIENQVGPVRLQTRDEWHEGGHVSIQLRRRPSFGYGTTPVEIVMAASEYRGPIEYALALVANPTLGSVYSVMQHAEMGLIVRRTAGGGTLDFWRDVRHPQQSIHITYQAGQEKVPAGVRMAALEAVRWHYENTMMVGRGYQTVADQQEGIGPAGSRVLPGHALSHLAPYRRAPAFA